MTFSSLVVLGLGSNLGNSREIIHKAMDELEAVLSDLRRASLYETAPMYVRDQNNFINSAVSGFLKGSCDVQNAFKLLSMTQKIEKDFGRDRSRERRWGERFLDIDILLFGDLIINEENLTVPHPRLNERSFALDPLLELLPNAKEPGSGIYYRDILKKALTLVRDR